MDQPPAVALTASADSWPRAIETEIGATVCAVGRGKDFDFVLIHWYCYCHHRMVLLVRKNIPALLCC